MKYLASLLLVLICLHESYAQQGNQTELFTSQEPMNLKLEISFNELKDQTNDSTYMDGILHYEQNGVWDSLKVNLKKRGNFRLEQCFFTPLKLKIKKKHAAGTPFAGNKILKLVLPCERTSENNSLVIKELICYKIYEQVSPYSFSTRAVNIELTETSKKNEKSYELKGFFIEDDEEIADRFDGVIKKNLKPHPLLLKDTVEIQHAMFQYLISNLDWSTTNQHNAKIMVLENPITYIPLAYDFDHSGLVDASYATVIKPFDAENLQVRIYRGFCQENADLIYYVRDQFLQLESEIFQIMDNYASEMTPYTHSIMTSFVTDFFNTLRDESEFKSRIVNTCRTK